MTSLESRPVVLGRVADRLWTRYDSGLPLRVEELDALAEACFRLAVRSGTAPDESLALLAKAHRVDPVNPKHLYHAGLVHLRHGRLTAARELLTAGAESAPANHRVWAHLSIVHQGLHERLTGDPSYGGEERARVEEIASAIREGRDDLSGADDVPSALLRPGRCRWSGIHDISAEMVLRREPGERGRDAIAEDLRQVAALATHRLGGAAAFAVLATQWLVHGYPPATIRGLAAATPPGDGPARRLVDLVCELFEADEETLPARLATCLAEHRLPDLLVALIHQQRLLWRPLCVPDLVAYTAARRFADGVEQGDAVPHLAAMASAVRALAAPTPPKTVPDVPAPGAARVRDPGELATYEEDASSIARLKQDTSAFVKRLRAADLAHSAQIHADHALVADVARRLEGFRTGRLRALREFRDNVVLATDDEEVEARLERCEKKLQQPLGLNTHLSNVRRKLLAHSSGPAEPVPPSPAATAIATALAAIAPAVTAEPAAPPPPPSPAGAGDPRARVAAAVAEVERALAANADRAWRSLDAYPPILRRRSALVLLRSYLDGHLAETRHRMGDHISARRHWQAMLTERPLSTALLHNLAVAHTAAGEVSAATQTWTRYVEGLYAEALLAGTPARGAAERAEIHRVLAGSFGTAALCGRPDDDTPDTSGVPAELASPARVALAMAHLRLEELNRALSYRSAVLRLGVARSVRRSQLDEAFDHRLNLVTTACSPLPARVRAPFEELCRTAFRTAYETARDPGARTQKATDEAEVEAHAAWMLDRVRWKARIAREVTAAGDWPVTESSGEILTSLRLVDELRLDETDETVRRAVLRLGAPASYLRQLNDLSDLAARFAVERVFRAAEDRLDSSADFPERYRGICLSWQRNGAPERYLELLDDPQPVYLPSVARALDLLNARAPDDEVRAAVLSALPAMEHWVARLLGAPGPAAMLGELLNAVNERHRATAVLAAARAAATPRDSLARVRLAIECHDFPDATARLHRFVEQREGRNEDARRLMITTYHRWVASDGPLPAAADIRNDLDRWSHPENVHARRLLLGEVVIVRHQRRPGDLDIEALAGDLRQLLRDDQHNSHVRYQLVLLLYQRAVALRTAMRATFGQQRVVLRDDLARLRQECATHAAALLAETATCDRYHVMADEARRQEVETIASKVTR